MANITDSELTTIQNAVVSTRQALEPDNSRQAQELKKKIVEVNGYFRKIKRGTITNSCRVIQKTKALFNMFHRHYEPEPIGEYSL